MPASAFSPRLKKSLLRFAAVLAQTQHQSDAGYSTTSKGIPGTASVGYEMFCIAESVTLLISSLVLISDECYWSTVTVVAVDFETCVGCLSVLKDSRPVVSNASSVSGITSWGTKCLFCID